MSDTRKAVITTVQVQEALNKYSSTLAVLSGQEVSGLEFDKGARGKGFAVYNKSGEVVDSFDTKEDAFVKYVNWVTVATQVLQIQQTRTEREAEAAKTPKTPAKATQKAAA